MAQSDVLVTSQESFPKKAPTHTEMGERRLRRITAWTLLFFLIQGELGAIWDREWHFFVGRDWFWTPPHTLIYSCAAGAGLIALVMVLAETALYHWHRPGVDDSSTVKVLAIFHAPIGFILAGTGVLIALIAAPLDNYWHELYGIDIALWAPFHMMGVTGGVIAILGMIYIFASETAHEREARTATHRFLGISALEWGTLFIIAGLMNFTLIGFLQFPVARFGLLSIPTYAIPLALCGALLLTGAVRLTHLPGTATLTVLLLLGHTTLEELFVPWAIRTGVAWQGLEYRVAEMPVFRMRDAFFPLVLLPTALIIDGVARWHLRCAGRLEGQKQWDWLLGVIITILQLLLAPCILKATWNLPLVFLEQPDMTIPADMKLQAALVAVPVILAFGALGALGGAIFGDIWRWNKR
jgi:hypothetical protein